jgi:hypothetical protein
VSATLSHEPLLAFLSIVLLFDRAVIGAAVTGKTVSNNLCGRTGCQLVDPGSLGSASDSGHSGDDLCIGREATDDVLRTGNTVVDADLKDAPARTLQAYLRIWPDLADELRRRTGARFIVSLAAVFDLDAHRLPSIARAQ